MSDDKSPEKRSRFKGVWETLNKPFVIYILSGVAGLVVLYFTGHRECITEANKIIDRRAVLQSELFTRDLNWKARIDQAKTPQEAFTMPDKRGSSHAELKDISYSDLETEFRNLMGRINYEDISGFDIARRLTWSDIIQPVIDKMYDEAQAPIDGKQPRMNPRRSLPFSKLWAEYQFNRKSFENSLDLFGYHYTPKCSVVNLIGMALGYKPRTVSAEANVMNAEIRKLLDDEMNAVDKAAKDLRAFHESESEPKK